MSKPTSVRYQARGKSDGARKIFGQPPKDCPKCSAKGGVYNTRVNGSGIWRRRICKRGHRWTTFEMLVAKVGVGRNTADLAAAALRKEVISGLISALREMK